MNERLAAFLNAERKRDEEEKRKTLFELGLVERVYAPDNKYSSEFYLCEWSPDGSAQRYYKNVPIEITDEEYQEVKKCLNRNTSTKNPVATTLTVISWIIFIGGFIAGIVLGKQPVIRGTYYQHVDMEFSFAAALVWWATSFISGMIFLGFAEIIKLLHAIKNKE